MRQSGDEDKGAISQRTARACDKGHLTRGPHRIETAALVWLMRGAVVRDNLNEALASKKSDLFLDGIEAGLGNFFSLRGRASRAQYWGYMTFFVLAGLAARLLDRLFAGQVTFASIHLLLLTVPAVTITVRRLHDTGRSGWWVMAVPAGVGLVGLFILLSGNQGGQAQGDANQIMFHTLVILACAYAVLLFSFLCQRGMKGANRFGP